MPFQPIVLKDAVFKDKDATGKDYAGQVSAVTFEADSSTQTWQGLTPTASYSDVTAATWSAAISYAQDWEDPDSFSNWLYDQYVAGTTSKTVTFEPKKGGQAWEVDLMLAPGTIGGEVNEWMVSDVTLGISGMPRKVPPAGGGGGGGERLAVQDPPAEVAQVPDQEPIHDPVDATRPLDATESVEGTQTAETEDSAPTDATAPAEGV